VGHVAPTACKSAAAPLRCKPGKALIDLDLDETELRAGASAASYQRSPHSVMCVDLMRVDSLQGLEAWNEPCTPGNGSLIFNPATAYCHSRLDGGCASAATSERGAGPFDFEDSQLCVMAGCSSWVDQTAHSLGLMWGRGLEGR